MGDIGSRQIAWFEVFEFVARLLTTSAGSRPTAGTPAWCALPDDDPRKVEAVLIAGVHMALHLDTEQEQRAQAAQQVSIAGLRRHPITQQGREEYEDRLADGTEFNWPGIARRVLRGRGEAYIDRRKESA